MLCAKTCACDSLLRGSGEATVATTTAVCPQVCLLTIAKEEHTLTPCEDVYKGDPNRWQRAIAYVNGSAPNADRLRDAFLADGCETFLKPQFAHYCLSRDPYPITNGGDPRSLFLFKLFTYMCPITCNCGRLRPVTAATFAAATDPVPPPSHCPAQCVCPWPPASVLYAVVPGLVEDGCEILITPIVMSSWCSFPQTCNTTRIKRMSSDLFGVVRMPANTRIDRRCCYALERYFNPHLGNLAIYDKINNPISLPMPPRTQLIFNAARQTLCQACRERCLTAFENWTIELVDETYDDDRGLLVTAANNVTLPTVREFFASRAFDLICSSKGSSWIKNADET